MHLSYLSVGLEQELNFRRGLSCYRLGLFFYIFTRILPGLFDNFNIYLLHLETFFDNHLFLSPGAAKAEGPLGLASMQLPVFFPESAYLNTNSRSQAKKQRFLKSSQKRNSS